MEVGGIILKMHEKHTSIFTQFVLTHRKELKCCTKGILDMFLIDSTVGQSFFFIPSLNLAYDLSIGIKKLP